MEFRKKLSTFGYYSLVVVSIVIFGVILWLIMGQPLICECGYIKFWHGATASPESSQHIADWYSPSHLIHGFVLYWVLHWLLPDSPIALRLLVALAPEIAWEIIENTDYVIEYYRNNTVSFDYTGDSVINSVSDVLFMVVGFFLSAWLPAWIIILLAISLEATTLYFIRDGLLLNIIMFIYPAEWIVEWQSAS